jgi:hypothetical protein
MPNYADGTNRTYIYNQIMNEDRFYQEDKRTKTNKKKL